MNLRGLRIITNLHCNFKCKYCYQHRKTEDILNINSLKAQLQSYSPKYFNYCTIMGGESTLLPNLTEYIATGDNYSKEVRLTTNGILLTPQILQQYKSAGLTGINISIASLKKYNELTQTKFTSQQILEKVNLALQYFPNLRINIALCEENMNGEIKELIHLFVDEMNCNVTICESMTAKYSCLDDVETKLHSKLVDDTGYGLIFLQYNGKQYGYYSHKDNYKHTDLVVTPLGTWTNWDGYCHAVGLTNAIL